MTACNDSQEIPIFGTKQGSSKFVLIIHFDIISLKAILWQCVLNTKCFYLQGIHLSVSGGKAKGGINGNQLLTGNFTYNTWTHVALQYNNYTQNQVC